MTTSKKEIHHNVLKGLTGPTPFRGVVVGAEALLTRLNREHLSEEKRIKLCEDSKDADTQSIQDKNCQILHHGVFVFCFFPISGTVRSDLWTPLLQLRARPLCWIAVCTYRLNSHRSAAACRAIRETNVRDCTRSGTVSDCGCDGRTDFLP